QHGCTPGLLAEFSPDTFSGPYLLTAVAQVCTDNAHATDPPPAASMGWLLLAGASQAERELAQALPDRLIHVGHPLHAQHGTDPSRVDTVYSQAKARLGHVDAIVHMDGLAQAKNASDPSALLNAQVHRCALAAAAAQTLERHTGTAALWLITAGAARHLVPGDTRATLGDAALRG